MDGALGHLMNPLHLLAMQPISSLSLLPLHRREVVPEDRGGATGNGTGWALGAIHDLGREDEAMFVGQKTWISIKKAHCRPFFKRKKHINQQNMKKVEQKKVWLEVRWTNEIRI